MQTTITKVDSQRKIIKYHTFAGIVSFMNDRGLSAGNLYETAQSYSYSVFKNHVRTEFHVFYKP